MARRNSRSMHPPLTPSCTTEPPPQQPVAARVTELVGDMRKQAYIQREAGQIGNPKMLESYAAALEAIAPMLGQPQPSGDCVMVPISLYNFAIGPRL